MDILEKTSPFFSILIPVYNVSNYIGECLESIRAQTYVDWEVIIVNDGSTDRSGEICDGFSKEDSRIKVIHQTNQGVAIARNRLLQEAAGKYIIFLDGDDFWHSGEMLFEVFEAILEHRADMIAWWLKVYDIKTGRTVEWRNSIDETADVRTGESFLMHMLSDGISNWWGWLYAFERSLWEKNGIVFNVDRKVCEDAEVLFRVLLKAKRVWVVGKYYYVYRIREGSVTNALTFDGIKDMLEVAETNIEYLKNDCVIEKNVKMLLIKNFSALFISAGQNLYGLDKAERKASMKQFKDRKWMLKHLKVYGGIKFRIKVMIIRLLGIKIGFELLDFYKKRKNIG